MADTLTKTIKELLKTIKEFDKRKTSPYDTRAEVIRVDGNIAYVHIPGGVAETPVDMTVNAKAGDMVQVRVSGGRAWIIGNATAPPTDDVVAIQATNEARNANTNASKAKLVADKASDDAAEAYQFAGTAVEAANIANRAANSALESAETAHQAADAAVVSANEAKESARSANNSANNALVQLSVVEDVAGTLRWISEHGDYVLTNDDHVFSDTVYFIKQGNDYVPIASPDPTKNPSAEGWYVLDVSQSTTDYIMAHLAVTSYGLWVLPVSNLAEHYIQDSNGNFIIDSNDNKLVDFSDDPQKANGYKVLLSGGTSDPNFPIGLSIYNDEGELIANYGTETTIGSTNGYNTHIDTNGFYVRDGLTVLAKYGATIIFYEPDGITEAAEIGANGMHVKVGEIGGWTIDATKLSRSDGNNNTVKLISTGMEITADNPYGSQQLVNQTKVSQGSILLKHYDTSYMSEATLTAKGILFDSFDTAPTVTLYGNPLTATPYVRVGERYDYNSETIYRYLQLYFNLNSGASGIWMHDDTIGYDYAPFWINADTDIVIEGDNEIDLRLRTGHTGNDLARLVFYQATDTNLVFRPNGDNLIYLGTSANRWKQLFAMTVTGWSAYDQRSDLKDKIIIDDHDWKVDEFIQGLKPIAYKWKEGSTGRIHMGFGAQDIAKLTNDLDIGDLSVYSAEVKTDGEFNIPYHGEDIDDSKLEWTMKYTELIAPMVLEIQRLMNRVKKLEDGSNG